MSFIALVSIYAYKSLIFDYYNSLYTLEES